MSDSGEEREERDERAGGGGAARGGDGEAPGNGKGKEPARPAGRDAAALLEDSDMDGSDGGGGGDDSDDSGGSEEDEDEDDEDGGAARKRRAPRRDKLELDEEDYELLDQNNVTGFRRPAELKRKRLQKASERAPAGGDGAGGSGAPGAAGPGPAAKKAAHAGTAAELKTRLFGAGLSDDDEEEAAPEPPPRDDPFDDEDEDEMRCVFVRVSRESASACARALRWARCDGRTHAAPRREAHTRCVRCAATLPRHTRRLRPPHQRARAHTTATLKPATTRARRRPHAAR
jgi:transcription elongation factor SPT6